jgi:transcriptional regulator with XRE-family HTH domain
MADEDLYRRLGRMLRTRRRLLGLTQAQVAQRCGTTFQQVQKYESGLTMLSVGRLIRLAEALEVSACSLLEGAAGLSPPPHPAHAPEPDRAPLAPPTDWSLAGAAGRRS